MHFISHSTLDKAAAQDVRDRLLKHGYSCEQHFLDSDQRSGIKLGEKWEKVIYDNLRDCQALLVLCSPNWLQSKWCFAELAAAKMSGKQIIPIVLQDCDRSSLSEYQTVFINQPDIAARDEAFERLFKDLESRGLGPKDHLPWPNPRLKDASGRVDDCPFPGLLAFDELYAAVYFGRERETQVVLEELRQMRTKGEPRLLLIVGGSGSGKSSLLMAGVLPRLKHTSSRTDWLVLPTLRFGRRDYPDALFEYLAEEIVAHFPPIASARGITFPDRKTLRDQFAADDAAQAAKAFLDAARDLTLACGCKDATVLLPIDQFEEFLPPSAGASGAKFLKFLEHVCQYRDNRLLIIGTMRSDYLDIYERQPHIVKSPAFYPWRLAPFPREQIENVIVKPAARAHVEVTHELREQLKQETPTTDALPLLAFTLEKLYRARAADKRLELYEYQSLGGMEGSIKHTAEEIMMSNTLPPNVESAVRLCFVRHLIQVNEKGEFVRLTARWQDLAPDAHPILEQFVTRRLLIKSERDGEVTLEVAHEAIFRSWEQLKTWLGTSADILRWRRDVSRDRESDHDKWAGLTRSQLATARDWPQQRHEELTSIEIDWINRAKRNVRNRVFALVSTTVVFALVAILAVFFSIESQRKAVEAESRRIAALSTAEREKRLDRALLLAIEAVRVKDTFEARCALFRALLTRPELKLFLHAENGVARSVAFSPNGQTLAAACEFSGSGDGILLWDMTRLGGPVEKLPVSEGDLSSIAFSPRGVLVAGHKQGITLWDMTAPGRKELPRISLRNAWVWSVAFCGDSKLGALVAPVSNQVGRVMLWDLKNSELQPYVLRGPDPLLKSSPSNLDPSGRREHRAWCLAFSPDCQTLAEGWSERLFNLSVWDLTQIPPVNKYDLKNELGCTHISAAFSHSGTILATGQDISKTGSAVALWAMPEGKLMVQLKVREDVSKKTAFSSYDNTWENGVQSLAFSREGELLAAGYGGRGVAIWDLSLGISQLQSSPFARNLPLPEGNVRTVAFSKDGILAAGYGGREPIGGVALWELTRRERLVSEPLALPSGYVENVSFSSDGKTLIVKYGSGDRAGEELRWKIGHSAENVRNKKPIPGEEVRSLAFSPDGKMLVAAFDEAGSGGGVALWKVDLNIWLRIAKQIANRNLTQAELQQYFPGNNGP